MYSSYENYTPASYGNRSPYHMAMSGYGASSAHASMPFYGTGQTPTTFPENPNRQTASDHDVKNFKCRSTDCGLNIEYLGQNLHNSVQFGCQDLDEFLFENGSPIQSNGREYQNSPVLSSSPSRSTNSTSPKSLLKEAIETLFRQEHAKSSNDVTSSLGRSLLCNESIICNTQDTTRTPFPMTPVYPCSPCSSISQPSTPNSPHRNSAPVSPHDQIDIGIDVNELDLALMTVQGYDFDPAKRKFTPEELKPQPILKKSRKVFVCEDYKDEKYWNRRKKNNFAAKRSRDARRVKENQIAMRASYLEKENDVMKVTVGSLQKETTSLKQRLAKYEAPVL